MARFNLFYQTMPMNFKVKHERLLKTISNIKLGNLNSILSTIEYNLQTSSVLPNKLIVPQEDNFQIPKKNKKIIQS